MIFLAIGYSALNDVLTITSASGTMASQTFISGVPQALTTNAFTRNRYRFTGWATSANGSVVYQDGQTITVTSNMTLYAKWSRQ